MNFPSNEKLRIFKIELLPSNKKRDKNKIIFIKSYVTIFLYNHFIHNK